MAKLFFKYGTMKSGKSAHLLMTAHNYESQDKRVYLLTSSLDDRWQNNDNQSSIVSRTGMERVAHKFSKNTKQDIIRENHDKRIHCVLVDESQFLSKKDILDLCAIVDLYNIPVICYGLKTDFLGQLFEGSKALLELADDIELIKTVCEYKDCHKKATMNLRKINGVPCRQGEQIMTGDNEYIPLCRKHYFKEFGVE